jgi:subtilisin family serine protease
MPALNPLDLIKLTALMEHTSGNPDLVIGLIDGPVAMSHPDLAGVHIYELPGQRGSTYVQASSAACRHGTFVAGILSARREALAPAICPNCTLLVRPIFSATTASSSDMPTATPEELAQAILDCMAAGAHVLNVSAALSQSSSQNEPALTEVLAHAARSGVITIVAAGNHGTLGSTVLTRHPWVVPVVAYDLRGRPLGHSNLGNSIGRHGLGAPGDRITSLGSAGQPLTLAGTSAATPFVTGAVALLWSAFPTATAAEIQYAVVHAAAPRRTTVVPPLLDAWAAYWALKR